VNRAETAQLLTIAAAVDKRTIGDVDVVAWHRLLVDADYGAACAAVVAWQREHREPVMPADILAGIRAARSTPAMRTVAEALDAAEHGPGDRLAADRDQPVPAIEGPAPRSGREALQVALDGLADRWRASVEARPPAPTGYVRRRRGQQIGRSAADTIKRLGKAQRDRGERVVDGMTDADRARAGRAVTVCHGCAVDISVPDGWDPTDPDSPRLHCGRCTPADAKAGSA
jgi:hypothetical protein